MNMTLYRPKILKRSRSHKTVSNRNCCAGMMTGMGMRVIHPLKYYGNKHLRGPLYGLSVESNEIGWAIMYEHGFSTDSGICREEILFRNEKLYRRSYRKYLARANPAELEEWRKEHKQREDKERDRQRYLNKKYGIRITLK